MRLSLPRFLGYSDRKGRQVNCWEGSSIRLMLKYPDRWQLLTCVLHVHVSMHVCVCGGRHVHTHCWCSWWCSLGGGMNSHFLLHWLLSLAKDPSSGCGMAASLGLCPVRAAVAASLRWGSLLGYPHSCPSRTSLCFRAFLLHLLHCSHGFTVLLKLCLS